MKERGKKGGIRRFFGFGTSVRQSSQAGGGAWRKAALRRVLHLPRACLPRDPHSLAEHSWWGAWPPRC